MMKPLISGFTENTIHTNKLQIDYDALEKRIQALEIVFNDGRGKNFVYDSLMGTIADEVCAAVPFTRLIVDAAVRSLIV